MENLKVKVELAATVQHGMYLELVRQTTLQHKMIAEVDGYFVLVDIPQPTMEEKLDELRYMRLHQCFSVINRGKLWYDKLSPTQIHELQQWYTAWLDVTATMQIPTKPYWIS